MLGIIRDIPQKWIYNFLRLFTIVLIIAWIMTILELFLPHTGVNYTSGDSFVKRHLYRVSGLFYKEASLGQPKMQTAKSSTNSYASLQTWSLQALYKEGNKGFIVVVISGKTYFLNQTESLQGYLLEKIEDKNAYLLRDGKRYKLTLDTSFTVESSKENIKVPMAVRPLNVSELEAGIVTREEVNRRIKDPKLIWSEIKISIFRKGGDIDGFIVRSVAHNSIFHHLGLRRNDIIVSVNNEKLDSIEKVQTLYKNINKIDALVIGVKRSNKIKELRYEIK